MLISQRKIFVVEDSSAAVLRRKQLFLSMGTETPTISVPASQHHETFELPRPALTLRCFFLYTYDCAFCRIPFKIIPSESTVER